MKLPLPSITPKGYRAAAEAGSQSKGDGVILTVSMRRRVRAVALLESQTRKGESAVKKSSIVGAAGTMLALMWTQSALAQLSCSDLTFTGPVARQFPNARDACLGVENRDGRPFAHFNARIRNVRGNIVEAEFKLPDGTYGRPISFTPDPDARVRIAGRTYRYRELSRGQELDVYLPPDRWEIVVPEDPEQSFAAAPTVIIFAISEPAPTVAANTLPRTASVVPLAGALGGLLTVLGFAVAGIRRRFF